MEPILFLVTSAPSSPDVERTFQTAFTLREQGHAVSLFLLQDGVLGGLQAEANRAGLHLKQALDADICIYALDEDLAMRGFTSSQLWIGIQIASYSQLVDLFEQYHRIVGAL